MLPFCGNCLTPGYACDFTVAISSYFPQKELKKQKFGQYYTNRRIYCPKCSSTLIVELAGIDPVYNFPIKSGPLPEKKPKTMKEFKELVKNYLKEGYVLTRGVDEIDNLIEPLILFKLETCPDGSIEIEKETPWIPEEIDYLAFCPKCYSEPLIYVSGTEKVDLMGNRYALYVTRIDVECPCCNLEPVWFKINSKGPPNAPETIEILDGPFKVRLLAMGNSYYSVAEKYPMPVEPEKVEKAIDNAKIIYRLGPSKTSAQMP